MLDLVVTGNQYALETWIILLEDLADAAKRTHELTVLREKK